jgi:hypothetical protein
MADTRRGEIDSIPESESAVEARAAVTMATPEISESPEGDVARQGQPPTVASATERLASPGVATDNREPLSRIALLQEYKTAIGRPVYPGEGARRFEIEVRRREPLPKGHLQLHTGSIP